MARLQLRVLKICSGPASIRLSSIIRYNGVYISRCYISGSLFHSSRETVQKLLPSRTHQSIFNAPHSSLRMFFPHVSSTSCIHTSSSFSEEEKSVLEKAVTSLKERKQQKAIETLIDPHSSSSVSPSAAKVSQSKPPLLTRIKNEIIHYYHGFRLLGLEISIASRLLRKTLRGQSLSRRELKQFRRTAGDVFRIVPFSVFIIIPFMEFLLPVYLWLFPKALPSTFQSKSAKEERKKKELRVKLQMAKFLQDTVEDMSVSSKNPKKAEAVKNFVEFFKKIRTTGMQATTEEIITFSKLFENELTLDNLSHKQLQALCRLVLLPTIGSSAFLRFQLRVKMKRLEADDKMIQSEGVESLSVAELQAASQARGMRALGMPQQRLVSQLQQWLDLHLNKKISISFLLLSRALYLPQDVPTPEVLKATLSNLPENIVDEAEVMVASTSGETIDNKRRVDVIKQQEQMIREEEREKMERERVKLEEEIKREAVFQDPLVFPDMKEEPFISVQAQANKSFTAEEIREMNEAVVCLKGLEEEKETLREIKEDREEYCEDIADLAQECKEGEEQLAESVASRRLGRKVESMLGTIDQRLEVLEKDYVTSTSEETQGENISINIGDNSITVEQLDKALLALRGTSLKAKQRSLFSVLDEDHDGNIKLDEIAEVIEALANEDTDISQEHISEIKQLIKLESKENNNNNTYVK
ncbi:PREDICTED: LETM1 and EF-hand domain-containing protein 1, mitochondrial-like [Amphimedon queenslandica]|uniref:Mitochondrial proton/calcium exchanger protein n=1 Tax=Amphimedon queenslandica TaxID=400682 RepID=A0AAN0J6T8_AMPQE|nr:PREDICTED: LETM1 and EF-hand domain-containing protein 1, mitochondrial-like [Amphimedon queenslandica]|eukprot:XP_019852441.1 PREDICTED: LETM1 and EF-hand domain-containing protein 1, mitochondrial-like [Amphimedon queenslandica]